MLKYSKVDENFYSYVYLLEVFVMQKFEGKWFVITGNSIIGKVDTLEETKSIVHSFITKKFKEQTCLHYMAK